ncbi:DNA helicase [Rhodobacter phage RcZahn]|nr:DNA helicase [Rhodobacter phage RcZahn]
MALLSEFIRHDKPLSTGATAVYPYTIQMERKYKFFSRFGEEVPLCFRDDAGFLHLPRALCPLGAKDERTAGKDVLFPTGPNPREYQHELFDETASFLKKGLSGVVSAYTGWGKTFLGYHAAYVTQKKTLVITTKDDIYKQWIADAPKVLGIPEHEVGEIRGDKCEVKGTKFVVAMIHSLSKDGKYPDWIGDEFGLVIFDEVHRLPADQFLAVATMFPALLRLGLSATVERSDGKELLIHAHIGPIRAKTEGELLIPKVLRFTTAWECPRVLREDRITGEKKAVLMPHEPGRTVRMEKIIAADPVRNHQLADTFNMVYNKGRKLVVFSTLISHLETLKAATIELGVPGSDVGMYVGASTKAEIAHREKIKARPVLFTTFSMMSEGTNLPWLDTCALAMPRSKVTQPVGRIRREYEGKGEPVVLDFVDNSSPVFAGYAAARLKWYQKIGCVVKEMN